MILSAFFQDVVGYSNQSSFIQGTCFTCVRLHYTLTKTKNTVHKKRKCLISDWSLTSLWFLFRCRQCLPCWAVSWGSRPRATGCRVEACSPHHHRWAAACCDTMVFIWLQPAGLHSSDSGLPSCLCPHCWCIHADSVSQLHHADLYTHPAANQLWCE